MRQAGLGHTPHSMADHTRRWVVGHTRHWVAGHTCQWVAGRMYQLVGPHMGLHLTAALVDPSAVPELYFHPISNLRQ